MAAPDDPKSPEEQVDPDQTLDGSSALAPVPGVLDSQDEDRTLQAKAAPPVDVPAGVLDSADDDRTRPLKHKPSLAQAAAPASDLTMPLVSIAPDPDDQVGMPHLGTPVVPLAPVTEAAPEAPAAPRPKFSRSLLFAGGGIIAMLLLAFASQVITAEVPKTCACPDGTRSAGTGYRWEEPDCRRACADPKKPYFRAFQKNGRAPGQISTIPGYPPAPPPPTPAAPPAATAAPAP